MRLTSREKILLAVFLVILVLAGAVYFAYLPVHDALQIEKQELEVNKQVLHDIESNILPIEQQMMLIDNFRKKYEIMQRTLPPVLYQEDILRRITKVLADNGILADEYTFDFNNETSDEEGSNETVDQILSSYGDTALDKLSKSMVEARFAEDSTEEEATQEDWEQVVSTIDVSIIIEGAYENIKSAILQFEEMENIVLVNNLTVAKDLNTANTVRGTIEMRFPYYYDNETIEKMIWAYESEFEKHYPFDYIVKGSEADPDRPVERVPSINNPIISDSGSILDTESGLYDRAAEESKKIDYDFEVIMSAPTSIHMSYYITKSDAKDFSLGSKRDSENITLTVTESGGKYAFNYETSLNTFPGVNDYYTFTPNYEDGIYLTVVSAPRVDEKDVGMGTLNIYNKTTKPLNIFVKTDDEKLPRLVMGTQEGNVTVFHD